MDNKIAGFYSEVERPVNGLLKYDEPIKVHVLRPGEPLPPPIPPKIRNVTPINVGFSVDMRKWAEDPTRWGGMDHFMFHLGKAVAEREYYTIVQGMFNNAGNVLKVEEKGILKIENIQEAKNIIRNKGLYADCILLHPDQLHAFRLSGELFEAWKVPTSYLPEEKRGRYFSGLIAGLKTYRANFIEGIAIVFESDKIQVVNTPLKISFDNIQKPSEIILERWCSSAPIIDNAVVNIILTT
jgi:hypothetical protein